MVEIIKVLERIDFVLQEKIYIKEINKDIFEFEFENHFLICRKNSDKLFEVIYSNLSIGTFIVLMEEYNIYHERYIYERLDAIEEDFYEQTEN